MIQVRRDIRTGGWYPYCDLHGALHVTMWTSPLLALWDGIGHTHAFPHPAPASIGDTP